MEFLWWFCGVDPAACDNAGVSTHAQTDRAFPLESPIRRAVTECRGKLLSDQLPIWIFTRPIWMWESAGGPPLCFALASTFRYSNKWRWRKQFTSHQFWTFLLWSSDLMTLSYFTSIKQNWMPPWNWPVWALPYITDSAIDLPSHALLGFKL